MTERIIKQVLVARRDLPTMSPGKFGVQCGHAFSGHMRMRITAFAPFTPIEMEYYHSPKHMKVALGVADLAELLQIAQAAKDAGLFTYTVNDLGLTCFDGPTMTCTAIGPAYAELIDPITRHLKLF